MAAAPTSASATSLTILVPSGARTGSISVAVGGQTGTSSENFTVTSSCSCSRSACGVKLYAIGGRSRHLCYHYRREFF